MQVQKYTVFVHDKLHETKNKMKSQWWLEKERDRSIDLSFCLAENEIFLHHVGKDWFQVLMFTKCTAVALKQQIKSICWNR